MDRSRPTGQQPGRWAAAGAGGLALLLVFLRLLDVEPASAPRSRTWVEGPSAFVHPPAAFSEAPPRREQAAETGSEAPLMLRARLLDPDGAPLSGLLLAALRGDEVATRGRSGPRGEVLLEGLPRGAQIRLRLEDGFAFAEGSVSVDLPRAGRLHDCGDLRVERAVLVRGLAPGRRQLLAVGNGLCTTPTGAADRALAAGEAWTNVRLRVRHRRRWISGRVVDDLGHPAAGAELRVEDVVEFYTHDGHHPCGPGRVEARRLHLDEEGRFEVPFSGDFVSLVLDRDGVAETLPSPRLPPGVERLDLGVLRVAALRRVEIVFPDEAPPADALGFVVRARGPDGRQRQVPFVWREGSENGVLVAADSGDWEVTVWIDGVKLGPFGVPAGLSRARLPLPRPARVLGTLSDRSGRPLAGALLALVREAESGLDLLGYGDSPLPPLQSRRAARTDARGRFELDTLVLDHPLRLVLVRRLDRVALTSVPPLRSG